MVGDGCRVGAAGCGMREEQNPNPIPCRIVKWMYCIEEDYNI
jgi:hypothetical protein